MVAKTTLATLADSTPDRQLEVCLEQRGDGHTTVTLNEQHYAEGLGWYNQRSIRLEPQQWSQLQAVLGSKLPETRRAASVIADGPPPISLPFPGLRPEPADRPAAERA